MCLLACCARFALVAASSAFVAASLHLAYASQYSVNCQGQGKRLGQLNEAQSTLPKWPCTVRVPACCCNVHVDALHGCTRRGAASPACFSP